MVRDGWYYGLAFFAVAALLYVATHVGWLPILPVLLGCFFLWFFRDPNRRVSTEAGAIVSPADGLVTEAEWIELPAGPRIRLSIFLNVFDVHVNRSPVSGVVRSCELRRGRFQNAMNSESVNENEQTLVVLDAGGYEVSFKQIAGLLARRIVCRLRVGQRVERGERIGLIKFGSRVDVLMPGEAELLVKTGQRVRCGSTVLARMPVREPNAEPAPVLAQVR